MNASSAVRSVQGWSGGAAFLPCPRAPILATTPRFGGLSPDLRLKALLKRAGVTITQVSAATRRLYGHSTSFFIPATFLYKIRAGITPHVCQLAALSHITGISFWQCMWTCGPDVRVIPTVQLRLQRNETVLLSPGPAVQTGNYCQLAKIGRADSEALPELSPNSIMCVNAARKKYVPPEVDQQSRIWLIEHERGLACCHLEKAGKDHVRVLPSRPPFWAWPLQLDREIRILGEVDVHCRSGNRPADPSTTRTWHSVACRSSFSRLLRTSRSRAGLTFRAAHDLSIQVSHVLGSDYAIGIGALSDYEASDLLPRHITKIFALCIVYCMDFMAVLRTVGIHILDSGEAQIDTSPSLESSYQALTRWPAEHNPKTTNPF